MGVGVLTTGRLEARAAVAPRSRLELQSLQRTVNRERVSFAAVEVPERGREVRWREVANAAIDE